MKIFDRQSLALNGKRKKAKSMLIELFHLSL